MKNKTIEVLEYGLYKLDGNLQDVINQLKSHLDLVPALYKGTAYIDLNINEHYGSKYVIRYSRPETPSEKKEREKVENERTEDIRLKERKQLKDLLEKYPDEFNTNTGGFDVV